MIYPWHCDRGWFFSNQNMSKLWNISWEYHGTSWGWSPGVTCRLLKNPWRHPWRLDENGGYPPFGKPPNRCFLKELDDPNDIIKKSLTSKHISMHLQIDHPRSLLDSPKKEQLRSCLAEVVVALSAIHHLKLRVWKELDATKRLCPVLRQTPISKHL